MSYIYLSRWKWVEDAEGARWQPPEGCEWALDLRSVPQMSRQGGVPEGYGIFSLKQENAEAGQLLNKKAVKSVLGLDVQSDDPEDIAWELLTVHADPTGNNFARPLMPDHRLEIKFRGRAEAFDPIKHALVITNIQNDYRRIRAQSLSIGSNQYLKVLGGLERKYGLPAETFIPDDLPKEKALKPSTTITDDFNRASLGSDWTVVVGSWDIYSNQLRCYYGGQGHFACVRCIQDLSSDDHYSQIDFIYSDNAGRGIYPLIRFADSAETFYGYMSDPDHDRKIFKSIAGTVTVLTNDYSSSAPTTLKLKVDGSTLTGYDDGGVTLSTSDTSITGNTKTGVGAHSYTYDTLSDNFEAADLGTGAPVEKTAQETGSGAEGSALLAAVTRGESGGGADTRLSLLASLAKADSGSGSEQSTLTSSVVKTSAETGSGADAAALTTKIAANEIGLGVDSGMIMGLKQLFSGDGGTGGDFLKALIAISSSGSDMKLPGRAGHVRIPSKGVSI